MVFKRRIIWIDDDHEFLKRVKFLLSREGTKVICYGSVEKFYDELLADSSVLETVDAVIFDFLFQDPFSYETESNASDCDISFELRNQFKFKGPLLLCSQYSFEEYEEDINRKFDQTIPKKNYSWRELVSIFKRINLNV